jgi:hypothetical protein
LSGLFCFHDERFIAIIMIGAYCVPSPLSCQKTRSRTRCITVLALDEQHLGNNLFCRQSICSWQPKKNGRAAKTPDHRQIFQLG